LRKQLGKHILVFEMPLPKFIEFAYFSLPLADMETAVADRNGEGDF
jgi:hypothetical protein